MKLRIVVVLGALALAPAIMPALASEPAHPAIGDISVFATGPSPGHPLGVAVDKNRIYISTSAGDFFASPFTGGHLNSDGERVFAYDMKGNLYMTDDKPRLWKVTTDGHASIWFQDPRIAGLFGFAGGPLGGRIDPTGKFLYFTITI